MPVVSCIRKDLGVLSCKTPRSRRRPTAYRAAMLPLARPDVPRQHTTSQVSGTRRVASRRCLAACQSLSQKQDRAAWNLRSGVGQHWPSQRCTWSRCKGQAEVQQAGPGTRPTRCRCACCKMPSVGPGCAGSPSPQPALTRACAQAPLWSEEQAGRLQAKVSSMPPSHSCGMLWHSWRGGPALDSDGTRRTWQRHGRLASN